MKTELVLLGRHFQMSSRSRRRKVVVLVYLGLTLLITFLWFAARSLPGSIAPVVWWPLFLVPILLNAYIFGGFARWNRGLIKPYFGNETLKSYGVDVSSTRRDTSGSQYLKNIYQNDERDLRRRNDAHWRAYRLACAGTVLLFGLALMKKPVLELGWASSSSLDALFCCVAGGLMCVCATLPQAILLWTEPDMEEVQ